MDVSKAEPNRPEKTCTIAREAQLRGKKATTSFSQISIALLCIFTSCHGNITILQLFAISAIIAYQHSQKPKAKATVKAQLRFWCRIYQPHSHPSSRSIQSYAVLTLSPRSTSACLVTVILHAHILISFQAYLPFTTRARPSQLSQTLPSFGNALRNKLIHCLLSRNHTQTRCSIVISCLEVDEEMAVSAYR
jgi:hypothetical protein